MRPSAEKFKEKYGNRAIIVLEVGVWQGDNAVALLQGLNCHRLYLLDSWHDEYQGYKYPGAHGRAQKVFRRFDKHDNVIIVRADSLDFPLFPAQYFDYIYLDGDHSYEYVSRELVKYWACLEPGGMLAGDNYEMDGVRKAVGEFCVKANNYNLETDNWKKTADGKTDVLDWWIWK
jgi:predicted O-methyltransferase YrrM